MKDEYKTKRQLMDELANLRRKLADVERSQAAPEHKDGRERQECTKDEQIHSPTDEGERARLLDKMETLLQIGEQVLRESTVKGLLDCVLKGARDLTGAKVGVSGHLHGDSGFRITASSRSEERSPCPDGDTFTIERGGVYLEILEKGRLIFLKEKELKHRPAWKGLPEGHAPLRGLMGAPLRGAEGSVNGLIMISDKDSGDFDEEDAFFFGQLAVFASLALQHVEAREELEKRALEAEDRRKVLEVAMENTPTGISVADFPSMKFRMMNRYGRELIGIPTAQEVEGKPIADVLKGIKIFEKDGITECTEEQAPLRRAMRLNGNVSNRELVMVTPEGRELVLLCSARPVRDQSGRATGGVLAWRNITSLRAAEKELDEYRRGLERRVHERTADLLRMKQELELRIEEQKAVERTLRKTNEILEKIFGTTNFCVAYLDTEFKFVRVNAAYAGADGRAPEFFTGKNHFDLYPHQDNRRIFQGVLKTGEPYIAHAKPFVYPEHPERGTTYWDWTLHPVRDEVGNIEGLLLCLIDVTQRIRTQEQLAQSERELRSLSAKILHTQEMERKIISKDIHDSIGSSLAAVKFRLENQLTAMGQDPAAEQRSLEETISVLKETIRDTRRICTDLRPSMLDNMGILATLRWVCREFGNTYGHMGIEVVLDVQEEEIPERLKVILFRISQEALHNAAEHSKATRVHLKLLKKADFIFLTILDNGTGFDLKEKMALKTPVGGMGLASMRERATLSGGSLSIVSTKGEGTTIQASWPASESAVTS